MQVDEIELIYQIYSAGTAILETDQRLTESEEGTTQQFLLLSACLQALAQRREPADLILNSYLLRALAIAGWAPSFTDCAKCGRPGPHRAFAVIAGGTVCSVCRPRGLFPPTRSRWNFWARSYRADGSEHANPSRATAAKRMALLPHTCSGIWSARFVH